jgi:hypothetical protein
MNCTGVDAIVAAVTAEQSPVKPQEASIIFLAESVSDSDTSKKNIRVIPITAKDMTAGKHSAKSARSIIPHSPPANPNIGDSPDKLPIIAMQSGDIRPNKLDAAVIAVIMNMAGYRILANRLSLGSAACLGILFPAAAGITFSAVSTVSVPNFFYTSVVLNYCLSFLRCARGKVFAGALPPHPRWGCKHPQSPQIPPPTAAVIWWKRFY